jgi:riboflavin kinase / FMN adenylyltransferase
MQILNHWDLLQERDQRRPLYLVIGAFDGIHCGHQALIRQAVEQARSTGGEAWLLTFNPHPSRVLRPLAAPPLLTSTAHKLRLLAGLDLDGVIVHPFDHALAALSPEQFVAACVAAMPGLHTIIVGVNWRFGHRAMGDVQLLQELSKSYRFHVCVPDPVPWQDEIISSTRIRQAVEAGRLQDAEQMLGRPFSLLGRVTTGKQYGRELGFPTANIQLEDEARPPTGVYAVYGIHDNQRFNGAAYLGIRPTAHGEHRHHLLEVHFFDVNLDLYGYEIEVFFIQFIRPDQHFADHHALKAQIARDVEQSRGFF